VYENGQESFQLSLLIPICPSISLGLC